MLCSLLVASESRNDDALTVSGAGTVLAAPSALAVARPCRRARLPPEDFACALSASACLVRLGDFAEGASRSDSSESVPLFVAKSCRSGAKPHFTGSSSKLTIELFSPPVPGR